MLGTAPASQVVPGVSAPGLKTCASCATPKPVSLFLSSKFTADGLSDNCRPCIFDRARHDREQRDARKRRAAPSKICTCCGHRKSLTAFAPHKRAKDGLRRQCTSCVAKSPPRRPRKGRAH